MVDTTKETAAETSSDNKDVEKDGHTITQAAAAAATVAEWDGPDDRENPFNWYVFTCE